MFRPNWLIPILHMLLMPFIVAGMFYPPLQLMPIPGCIFLILLMPFWSKKNKLDLFSPWAVICYGVFFTILLNSIYVTFDLPSPEYIQDFYLQGKPKEFLIKSSYYVLIGMFFLTLGYISSIKYPRKLKMNIFRTSAWNGKRYLYISFLLMLVSLTGLYYYIKVAVEGNLVDNLSAYRRIASTELSEYRSYGFLAWLVMLSNIVYIMSWTSIISKLNKYRLTNYVLFILSSLTFIIFGIISGVRSISVAWLISIIVLTYYLRNKRISARFGVYFLLLLFLIFSIFSFMTNKRLESHLTSDDSSSSFSIIDATAQFIASGNGIDISKTGYIIEAIPAKMDYQWGATFFNILFAWIPREIWPNKPIAALDGIIAMKIYGAEMYGGGGIPPGLIAELYLNFGLVGIPVGCFLLGCLVKLIYIIFSQFSHNINMIIIYVSCFMQLGYSFMGSGFVSTLISFFSLLIPIFTVLHFITNENSNFTED